MGIFTGAFRSGIIRRDIRTLGHRLTPYEALLQKLLPDNRTGPGSGSRQGNVIPTPVSNRPVLDIVNTYLKEKLTADELRFILDNRDRFVFTIGTGDRRADFSSRFSIATNWHGGDVTGLVLTPDPYNAQQYRHTLTFSASQGTMSLTDTHSGANNYGSIRYFTISGKG
ncbi:hypothetical protein QI600_003202 [Salmonella enterica]|nr:hypothetical protein [Salmonella enterica]